MRSRVRVRPQVLGCTPCGTPTSHQRLVAPPLPLAPGCHCSIAPPSPCPGCPSSAVWDGGDKSPTHAQRKGTSPSKVPRLVAPGLRTHGWWSRSSTELQGWSVALRWWLCPVPHAVPLSPAVGSSPQPPRCLFFQPLRIFLARAVCSQVLQQDKGRLCGQEPWPTPSSHCGGHQLVSAQPPCPPSATGHVTGHGTDPTGTLRGAQCEGSSVSPGTPWGGGTCGRC